MTSLVFVQLLRKKFIFHLYGNIEGRFKGLPVTSSMTSSPWKYFFRAIVGTIFQYLMSNWSCNEYLKKIQNDESLGLGRTFSSEVSPEVEHIITKLRACPTFWAFDRRSSSNISEVMTISKIDLLFYLMTSSVMSSTPKSIQLIPQTGSIFVPSLVLIAQTARLVSRR